MNELLYLILFIILVCLILFDIIMPIVYLKYIQKMKRDNVKCSEGFSRNFIQGYSIYLYISIVALIILSLVNSRSKIDSALESPTWIVMTTGISFLIGYYLYQYQKKVYHDCPEAVETWEPKVMRVHSYIIAVAVLISLLNIIKMLNGNMSFKNKLANSIKKNTRKLKL